MWLWQPKNLLKLRLVFWSRVLLVSALMHTMLLFFLLCVYKGDNFSYHFSVDRAALHEANIIFLPLQKRAAPVVPKSQQSAQPDGAKQSKVAKAIKKVRKVVEEPKPGTRLIAAPKPKGKKRLVKKNQIKKETLQNEKSADKKIESKVEPAKEVSKSAAAEQATKIEEQALYLGQADLDALQIQDAISHEILNHWKPPTGLANNVSCQIKVQLGWEGKISSVAVQESSGIVIFDISARTAAGKMQLPKWAWGKELIITFNQ